jgi:hypothetical protein
MGKYNTMLITGENIQYDTDKEVLTRLRRIKQEGDLRFYKFTERSFNTRKQVDVYLQAVQDVNSPDAYATDNEVTIEDIRKIANL